MTEQNPEQIPAEGVGPGPVDPTLAPPVDQPEQADTTTQAAPAVPAEPAPAKVGDLCTFTTEDDAGFTSITTCLVLEVFGEPDDDGDEVQLARVAVLPDERIVTAARLELRS